MERFRGTLYGLKKVGKYLSDGEMRKAYAEYKESEEIALRLIVNTILSDGWMVTLSQPKTADELASSLGYTNRVLLQHVLGILEKHEIIEEQNGTYSIKELKATPIRPDDIGTVLTNFYYDCAMFLPAALRGNTVPLDQVPRIVLEAVFNSTLTNKGRKVLLSSFGSSDAKEIGVAAFADVGLPFTLSQINELFNPERIHLFMMNYRWISPLTSLLRLLSEDELLQKMKIDLLGRKGSAHLDLFYGEEIFAFSRETMNERARLISSYLKEGATLVTNDPTIAHDEKVNTPAYVLMQTIEGYPQPCDRSTISDILSRNHLRIQTIGDNWIIADKVGA